jgi:2-methylaconitate cis-trans-isomerase PrpF
MKQTATSALAYVYSGREILGHILGRGKFGYEAFDHDDKSLGLFETAKAAEGFGRGISKREKSSSDARHAGSIALVGPAQDFAKQGASCRSSASSYSWSFLTVP